MSEFNLTVKKNVEPAYHADKNTENITAWFWDNSLNLVQTRMLNLS